MAEPQSPPPNPSPAPPSVGTVLPGDGRSPGRRRLDAQAVADLARRDNLAARDVLAASSASTTAVRDSARAIEVATAKILGDALEALRAVTTLLGPDVPALLDIDVWTTGGTATVRPHGDLDMLTSPHLEQTSVEHFDGRPMDRMVVDLSQISFLDSSGLAVLVEIRRVAAENQTPFALSGVSDRNLRLLELTRLDDVFTIV